MSLARKALAMLRALSPELRAVLLFAALLHGLGIGWDMPGSDAWDNDGVAPRDFLPGLAATFTPGDYFTYPPLHLAILSVLTLPIAFVALLHAHGHSVVQEIILPAYMTPMTIIARIVSVVMSLGILVAIAEIADEIAPTASEGRRAGAFAALLAAIGMPFTYYSHTSNLDVPSLFWVCFAALALVRAIVRREPRRLRTCALLAACAVATKDQTYAVFAFGVPALLAGWLYADPWVRRHARLVVKEAAVGAVLTIGFLLVVDGAIENPRGFRRRVAFLAGPASQDFAQYTHDWAGRGRAAWDTLLEIDHHWAHGIGLVLVAGTVTTLYAARRRYGRFQVAALVPLALSLSFTLGFNLAARRVEERFTLPQALMFSIYGGFFLARVASRMRVATAGFLVIAGLRAVVLDATLFLEPRDETYRFLREATKPGDTAEVYGHNVYLPRLPAWLQTTRVEPAGRPGPMPGVTELTASYAYAVGRSPKFILVNECWSWRYTDPTRNQGNAVPNVMQRAAEATDATAFFADLFAERLPYRLAHRAAPPSWLPHVEIHGSVGCPFDVFQRLAP